MARLVITHSTYVKGLIKCLKKLSKEKGISTITPGRITKASRNCEGFVLRVSVGIQGGYKLIARNGRSVQEVFVITKYCEEELKNILRKL